MYVNYEEKNETVLNCYHRWFIFVDADNTPVKELRMAIELRLSEVFESSLFVMLLGADNTYLPLLDSYNKKDIPIILFDDAISECLSGNLIRTWRKELNSEDYRVFLDGKEFELVPFSYLSESDDKMFVIDTERKPTKFFPTKGSFNLIIHQILRLSVKITPFERARCIVKQSIQHCDWIEYLYKKMKEHLFFEQSQKEDFSCLRETVYLLHYAVYKLKSKWNSQEDLKAKLTDILTDEEKVQTESKNRTVQEDKNVYKNLIALTEGAFKRKSLQHKFEYIDLLQELFIWSLMCNLHQLSKVLCNASQDILANCLVAHGLLYRMSLLTDDNQLRQEYRYHASRFNDYAIMIIRKNEKPTTLKGKCTKYAKPMSSLIEEKLWQWNGKSYFDIAVQNKNKEFAAEEVCKNYVNQVWMGKLSTENWITTCCICILFPPLIFFLVKEREETVGKESGKREKKCLNKICKQFYKLYKFYTSPFIVHVNHLKWHVVFLMLFTYLITIELTLELTWLEILIIIWVFSFGTEEIRQLVETTSYSKTAKFKKYWNSGWNKMDVASIVLFAAGFIARIVSLTCVGHAPKAMDATRICYAVSLLLYYLRVLRFFSTQKTLGPLLLMIWLMLKELMAFLWILSVFVISYSIATYSIAYPNSKLEIQLLWNVLRLGVWNIYGEFFLNEIEEPDCSFNKTEFNITKFNITMIPQCPTYVSRYTRPILMAMYYTITNVLLLNLLIAVFNKQIDKVSEKSDELWKWQRIELIRECEKKPVLIHPLILAAHAWKVLSSCRNYIYRSNKQEANPDDTIYVWNYVNEKRNEYDDHFSAYDNRNQSDQIIKDIRSKLSNVHTETDAIKTQIKEINYKMKEILEAVQLISKNVGETDEILPKDDKKI